MINFKRKPQAFIQNNIQPDKISIDDEILEEVSGGAMAETTSKVACSLGIIGGISALSCGVASLICDFEANKESAKGNISKSTSLSKTSQTLRTAAASFSGIAVVGIGTSAIINRHSENIPDPLGPNVLTGDD